MKNNIKTLCPHFKLCCHPVVQFQQNKIIFHRVTYRDPVCLTFGLIVQKGMEAIDLIICINKCLIASHYLLITDSRIARQVWITVSFLINESIGVVNM